MTDYIKYRDLRVYKFSRQLSAGAWVVYKHLRWQLQKTMGDQLLRSADSVGANIAEGYGRYHYLDKIKFYYISRGSLNETEHWIDLLFERNIITQERYNRLMNFISEISRNLNRLISSNYESRSKK